MVVSPQESEHFVAGVDPVMFIGLGGTGKETLLNIRRLFLDYYQASSPPEILAKYGPGRLPHTAFLCFDSEDGQDRIDGRALDSLLLDARMKPQSEFLKVELSGEKMDDLYLNRRNHPQYLPWFDFSLERFGTPKNGCGQTRPWGRASFFQHYPAIRTQVRNAILQLTREEAARDSEACQVGQNRDRVHVFVVFSIAGGTGAGMFLDMAFLLKDLARETKLELLCESVILLPEVFSNDPNKKIFANAYASLLELEYYSLKRPSQSGQDGQIGFPVYWPGEYDGRSPPRRLSPPAFDANWLIGASSRGVGATIGGRNIGPGSRADLCAMMGEWLFLRASPLHQAIGEEINNRASNFVHTEMKEIAKIRLIHPDPSAPESTLQFSRCFGSFGQAKIYLPTTVIHQSCAFRLAGDLLANWLSEPAQPATAIDIIRHDYFANLKLRVPAYKEGDPAGAQAIYVAIDRAGAGSTIINEALSTFDAEFNPDALASEHGGDLRARLGEKFKEFRRRFVSNDGANVANHGAFARQIAANRDRAIDEVKQGFEESLQHILCDSGRRFPFAANFLQMAEREFAEAVERAVGDATDHGNRADSHIADREAVLGHARGERGRGRVLATIAKVGIDDERQAIIAELDRQIAKAAADVATQGRAMVSERVDAEPSLVQQLGELQRHLQAMRDEAAATKAGLASRPTSILNLRLSADPDAYYLTPQRGLVGQPFINEVEARVFAAGEPLSDLVWRARRGMEGHGRKDILDKLVDYTRVEMRHVLKFADDALGTFEKAYPSGREERYTEALHRVIASGTAWMSLTANGDADWGRAVPVQLHYQVGVKKASGIQRRRLDIELDGDQARLAILDAKILDLDTGDAIHFIQEMGGFPPHVLPKVATYRNSAYLPYIAQSTAADDEKENFSLHLERDPSRFGSLVIPDAMEMSARTNAVTLLGDALLKGIVKVERDRFGALSFYYDRTVRYRPLPQILGGYDRAVLNLAELRSPDAQPLREALAQADRTLRDNAELQAKLFALIAYYLQDGRRPIKLDEWDRAMQAIEARLKEAFPDAVAAAQTAHDTFSHWTQEAPEGSGFRTAIQGEGHG